MAPAGRARPGPGLVALGLVALGLVAPLATGCGPIGNAAGAAPTIEVVTGLYPLAQAVGQIGGSKVTVTDVVPAGSDPRTYQLTPAQVDAVGHAAVVVVVGGHFQPSLEAAARGAARVVDLQADLGAVNPYVWLDPGEMQAAVARIAAGMEAANPPAASQYRDGAQAFAAAVASTGIDYESTLSACPKRVIVTADDAFAGMARRYGLTDEVVGTAAGPGGAGPAAVAAAAGRVRAAGVTTVFSEPFVPDGTIQAVAAAAHAKVRVLDPLTGAPPAGWPHQADYLRLMEANLGALNGALGCPDPGGA